MARLHSELHSKGFLQRPSWLEQMRAQWIARIAGAPRRTFSVECARRQAETVTLAESIKQLMRGSAQPVAIVSAFLPPDKAHEKPRFIHSATLSSFTTVSLSPPIVAFSIRLPSRMADALRTGAEISSEGNSDTHKRKPHFLIHILSSTQSPLSNYFARPGAPAYPIEASAACDDEEHPFASHPSAPSTTVDGQLVLRESLGALACSLVYQLDLSSADLHGTTRFIDKDGSQEAGSALFLGEIHAVEQAVHEQNEKDTRRPLVYWNQQYCSLLENS